MREPRLRPTLAVLLLAAACSEPTERSIDETRVATVPSRPAISNPTNEKRFGSFGMGAPGMTQAAPERPAAPIRWSVPAGWEELAPTDMRVANLRPRRHPDAECYLALLPGEAGGLAANVNRWRSQMGLDALSPAEIDAMPKRTVLGQPATLVELEGAYRGMGSVAQDGFGLLGAILDLPQVTIFVKMTGPLDVVTRERAGFDAFCDSLRIATAGGHDEHDGHDHGDHDDHDGHDGHDGHDHGAQGGPVSDGDLPPSGSADGLAWETPAGWRVGPSRTMRAVTFGLGASGASECYVTVLGGDGGGVSANLDRWRGQLGLSPFEAGEYAALERVSVLGAETPLFEAYGHFTGMGERSDSDWGMLGVVAPLSDRTVFVKLTGPEEEVRAARAAFVSFCKGLRRS